MLVSEQNQDNKINLQTFLKTASLLRSQEGLCYANLFYLDFNFSVSSLMASVNFKV